MKIKKIFTPQIITISISVVALLMICYAAYALIQGSPDPLSDTSPETAPAQLSKEDAANKQAYLESQKDTDTENTSSEGSSSDGSSISIESSQNGDTVTLITQIQAIGDGTCKLTIKNASETYTDSADVIYQPSHSSCAGFSIPTSKLGTGTWSITIQAISLSGSSASLTTTLEVK